MENTGKTENDGRGISSAAERKVVFADAGPEVDLMFTGERRRRMEELGDFSIHYGDPEGAEDYLQRVRGAHAIMIGGPASLPAEVMVQAENLEVISFTGRGVATYVDLGAAASQGVTVCISPGAAESTVAEHAVALMLACARHIPLLDRDVRAGGWNHALPAIELQGKNLGLLGCGPIALHFAKLARGIGMKVRAWTRNPSPARARRLGLELVSLDEILGESHVLSMHLAHTRETEGFLGTRELGRTRKGVIVLNTARGPLVDSHALAALLQSGHVAAAGLDVLPQEPPSSTEPLLQLDNVVLSPHVAWNTPEATERLYDIAVDNLVNFYNGTAVNVVAGPGNAGGC